ncbi:MAG TPA: hypothetical protein VK195_02490 [Burkholderiaceae bacterium]|nr:hypothetical protein [Burkholderiaceae bacterium]
MNVLIVTHSRDHHCTPLITRSLMARGATAWCFETDLFPSSVQLSLHADSRRQTLLLRTPLGQLDMAELTSCYYRRLRIGGAIPDSVPVAYREAAQKESRAQVLGLLHSLDCFQLDGYEKVRRADHKQLQLKVAAHLGLEVPDSLSTNEPQAVREFFASHPQGIVGKMLSSFAIYEQGMEKVMFTNRIRPEDLDHLDGLRHGPMTFQALVPKALELRVTIVGEQVFAAAIDSQSHERARTDWRREGRQMLRQWRHHTLPSDIQARLLALMDAFGLNYGAIDLILTPDGRHVFLEINPAGEFMWLERHPGLPIADALADVLIGNAPRRGAPGLLAADFFSPAQTAQEAQAA